MKMLIQSLRVSKKLVKNWRTYCSQQAGSSIAKGEKKAPLTILGRDYNRDEWTNVTGSILSHLDRRLHLQSGHPLNLLKRRIVDYMYNTYPNSRGNPLFSIHEQLSPVVTLKQNFDTLLVPHDHPSRKKSDSYYVNRQYMLRAHTSAHQAELIAMGLDNFVVIGDVYRRDTVDKSHHPVFHQVEGVRLFSEETLFKRATGSHDLKAFDSTDGVRTDDKQESHTIDAAKVIEIDLKECLLGLAKELFGQDIEYRWVDCYFPFTHPSWELEILYNGDWMEVLGCGVVEQQLLNQAGAEQKLGWAFGLGLERLAMKLYQIPDIRLFWSKDSGFLSQFKTADPKTKIVYKEVSKFPQCVNDMSFWLPDNHEEVYSENDFYDIVRSVGGDVVEQVDLVDTFYHPKKKQMSHCYRLTYRHMDKTLSQDEANQIHSQIEQAVVANLGVIIR